MSAWIRLLACSILWIPAYAIGVILWLLGIPIVLGLSLSGKTRLVATPITGERLIKQFRPSWAALWLNPEDHCDGPALPTTSPSTNRWIARTAGWPYWRRAFSWSALRNPVAGERMLWRPTSANGLEVDQWRGNCWHVHETWKEIAEDQDATNLYFDPIGDRYLWHFARVGLRSGLWVRRVVDMDRYSKGYDEIRLGFKVLPLPYRHAERWAGLGLQYHRVRNAD